MILTYRNRKIKDIPVKYKDICDITDYLDDFEHIRLTDDERQCLDRMLFEQESAEFIESMKAEPLVHEQIHAARPVMVHQVTTNDGQTYYSMKLSNGISVRCPKRCYDLSPTKGRIRYAAQLSPQIAPPLRVTTQLF